MVTATEAGRGALLLLVCAPIVVRAAKWLLSEPAGFIGAAVRVAVVLALLQGLTAL